MVLKRGDKMAVSKKQQACVNRYISKAYDRINFVVPKGEKDRIKSTAEAAGKSVNGFIWEAVQRAMEEANTAGNAK